MTQRHRQQQCRERGGLIVVLGLVLFPLLISTWPQQAIAFVPLSRSTVARHPQQSSTAEQRSTSIQWSNHHERITGVRPPTSLSLWPATRINVGISRSRRCYAAEQQQPPSLRRRPTGRSSYGRALGRIATIVSQRYNALSASPAEIRSERDKRRVSLVTLLRVGIPSLAAGAIAYLIFPALALSLATTLSDPGVFSVLSQDSSQFVQNFLTVAGLLFSILVGQTYYFLYTQQESIYYALFQEVTEAKSLLEQVALVCQGRSMYPRCLESISKYVQNDLKQIQSDPAVLLSARPVDDPLESIMYMTSVGVPSTVYETVKSLREARARRLGALQRKLPSIHFGLLWILAAIELVSFPLLGAGTQTLGGYNLLSVEGCLFGVMTGGIVMTLRVVGELWRPAGGAYNVDAVLSVMVSGLEEELKARMAGRQVDNTKSPSGAREKALPSSLARMEPVQEFAVTARPSSLSSSPKPLQQGADPAVAAFRIYQWIRSQFFGKSHRQQR